MIKKAFAVKRKELIKVDKSSTVGIATYLAWIYLLEGYIVYGTILDDKQVKFVRVTEREDIELLKGSKYCQSNLSDIFKYIFEDLQSDKKVFFCGTPCQVSGLKKYLEIKKGNLSNIIFLDLVCHGVASPQVFEKWMEYCERIKKTKIEEVLFRDKRYGWISQRWTIKYKNGQEETDSFQEQVFKHLYYGGYVLRPSCHSCKFASKNRPGDLTLGDFWNIQEIAPSFYSENGVGLVFTNTDQGLKSLDRCLKDYQIKEVDISKCNQPQLEYATQSNANRTKFWDDFEKKSFDKIANKYSGLSLFQKIKYVLNGRK